MNKLVFKILTANYNCDKPVEVQTEDYEQLEGPLQSWSCCLKAHTLIADLRTGTLEDWNTKGLGGKSGIIAHNFGAGMESVITLQTNLWSRYESVCKFATL